ncbi:hypothetical protein HY251_20445 [bacterium]|nr:hypothetical protein [bacterium]
MRGQGGAGTRTVAFATHGARAPEMSHDDSLVVEPAARLGVQVVPVPWDEPGADWAGFSAVVVRSTWDYHRRLGEFLAWIDRLERAGARLWNPPSVLRWNVEKTYLAELGKRGVSVVPTVFLEPGPLPSLARTLEERGWSEAVVKPAVSANAFQTFRVRAGSEPPPGLASLLERTRVLVQPFLRGVTTEGECSFVFLDGKVSHAVRKKAAPGEFLVQEDHGGHAFQVEPPRGQVEQAEAVLAAIGEPVLYARVDMVSEQGKLVLMELELTEPTLYLVHDAEAPGRFARALARVTR